MDTERHRCALVVFELVHHSRISKVSRSYFIQLKSLEKILKIPNRRQTKQRQLDNSFGCSSYDSSIDFYTLISKAYYQAFWGVLIDLIVELLVLIIKPFDHQTES